MDQSDRIRLQHMLDAAREALSFARGKGREDLDANRQFALSVVKCLEIVGEAANIVSPGTKSSIDGIPWPAIINMRHRLIHGYFTINLDIVWQTLIDDLPPLVAELENLVAAENNSNPQGA